MKQEDFNRLKAVCEKEGFDVLNLTNDDNEKYVLVKKQKDIWEGVEFVEVVKDGHKVTKGKIFKVLDNDLGIMRFVGTYYKVADLTQDGIWISQDILKPSTESAYIEQLKEECFKRFGEIEVGQEFKTVSGSIYEVSNFEGQPDFDYFKRLDQFFYRNVEIYESGKWATRVKERVKVESKIYNWSGGPVSGYNFKFEFRVKNAGYNVDLKNLSKLLASKLEEYLNKD